MQVIQFFDMNEAKWNGLFLRCRRVYHRKQVSSRNTYLQWESKLEVNKLQAHEFLFTDRIEQIRNPVFLIVNQVQVKQNENQYTGVNPLYCNPSGEMEG